MSGDLSDPLFHARSYDDVAEFYERVNAPLMFDAPARALVEVAALRSGERMLDVGAGTGAVSRAAMAATGSPAGVVALDPAPAMLMAARRGGVANLVVGALPHLPFPDNAFDAVLSAFVLTHVDDADAAARDMARVLRPGGRAALSAWSPADDEYTRTWSDAVGEFAPREVLVDAAARVLPGEERFSQADGLARLLQACGFEPVQTGTHTLDFALTLDQMVSSREVCATGRALRALLSDREWNACRARVREVLGNKFPDGIRYQRDVHIAVGTKR